MAQPNFYNVNRNRAYPFVSDTVGSRTAPALSVEGLLDSAIVDCGFVAGFGSAFAPAAHTVWLDRVERAGTTLYFIFASDAPGLQDNPLTFSRQITDEDYTVEHGASYASPIMVSATVSESAPDAALTCHQLGSSGTFVAPYSGQLYFYFNDEWFDDNSGSFTVVFDGVPYTVPGRWLAPGEVPWQSPPGVAGPYVRAGQSYSYTASGTVTWKFVPPYTATPDGAVEIPRAIATSPFVCPGTVKYSLVAQLLYTGGESASTSVYSLGATCEPTPAWTGYLVTGRLSELAAVLGDGQALTRSTDTGGTVEPCLVQSTTTHYMESLNLANQDRVRANAPDGCSQSASDDVWYATGPGEIFVAATCLRGSVRLSAGYNAIVRQETAGTAMVIGASPGAGAGEVCDMPQLFAGEIPPPDSNVYDGSPMCNEVIRSLNGIGGRSVTLLTGTGVTASVEAENHLVVIDVDMNTMAMCSQSV